MVLGLGAAGVAAGGRGQGRVAGAAGPGRHGALGGPHILAAVLAKNQPSQAHPRASCALWPARCSYAGAAYAEDDGTSTAVGQQALMPTPTDPKLWVVRCGEGQEREAVTSLLQKCYDLARKGSPLLIKAVFCQDHLKVWGCGVAGWRRQQR